MPMAFRRFENNGQVAWLGPELEVCVSHPVLFVLKLKVVPCVHTVKEAPPKQLHILASLKKQTGKNS